MTWLIWVSFVFANDANGNAQVDPITAELAILSEEKQKAKEYQVQTKAALVDVPKLYDGDIDYIFLCVYMYEQLTDNHINIIDNQTNDTYHRVSARANPLVSLCIGSRTQ